MAAVLAFFTGVFGFAVSLISSIITGALGEVGRFLIRPFTLIAMFALVFYLVAGVLRVVVNFVALSQVFGLIAASYPSAYLIAQWLFYLFAGDILLSVIPAFISARFFMSRLTFPL